MPGFHQARLESLVENPLRGSIRVPQGTLCLTYAYVQRARREPPATVLEQVLGRGELPCRLPRLPTVALAAAD